MPANLMLAKSLFQSEISIRVGALNREPDRLLCRRGLFLPAFAVLWRRMAAVGGNPSTLAAGSGIFLLSSRRYEGESGLTIQRGVSGVAQTSHWATKRNLFTALSFT
jgi:hypothetical protein